MHRFAGSSPGSIAHRFLSRVVVQAVLIAFAGTLTAAPAQTTSTLSPGEFTVHVDGDRISLEAQDAPMHEVLARLGDELDIPIEALTPAEETVTTEFHDLSLEKAMRRLSTRVVYVHDERGGGITKIVVLPEGEQAAMSSGDTDSPTATESFKFEFDPFAPEGEP